MTMTEQESFEQEYATSLPWVRSDMTTLNTDIEVMDSHFTADIFWHSDLWHWKIQMTSEISQEHILLKSNGVSAKVKDAIRFVHTQYEWMKAAATALDNEGAINAAQELENAIEDGETDGDLTVDQPEINSPDYPAG